MTKKGRTKMNASFEANYEECPGFRWECLIGYLFIFRRSPHVVDLTMCETGKTLRYRDIAIGRIYVV